MVMINISSDTLALLVSGLYCGYHNVDAMAVPTDIWLDVAKKLEHFVTDWDYNNLSFEEFIRDKLLIIPKIMLSEEDVKDLMETTLYWETLNGNAILSISMDIRDING